MAYRNAMAVCRYVTGMVPRSATASSTGKAQYTSKHRAVQKEALIDLAALANFLSCVQPISRRVGKFLAHAFKQLLRIDQHIWSATVIERVAVYRSAQFFA